ncbi:MAG: SDR family oxidoreductase [Planctomycetota bacterium]|nr:SDR family oxidoreductase [Planctomycetota bacterium]
MTTSPYRPDLLKGQHILITGGGTGLGSAIATRFASLGAAITICGRRRSPLEDTVAALRAKGSRAEGIPCDIQHREKVDEMIAEAESRQGSLTGLVNNAAGNFLSLSEQLDPRGFEAVMSINVSGTFHCTQACAQLWIQRKEPGSVLSIVTTYIETGSAFVMPSAASKAAIAAMMRSLAVEWGPYGIRLNAIAPGPIPTKGAWERLIPDKSFEEKLRDSVPIGRFATREELGNLAVYLMSDSAASMTGQVIELDGGARLAGHGAFNGLMQLPREKLAKHFDSLRPPRQPRPPKAR